MDDEQLFPFNIPNLSYNSQNYIPNYSQNFLNNTQYNPLLQFGDPLQQMYNRVTQPSGFSELVNKLVPTKTSSDDNSSNGSDVHGKNGNESKNNFFSSDNFLNGLGFAFDVGDSLLGPREEDKNNPTIAGVRTVMNSVGNSLPMPYNVIYKGSNFIGDLLAKYTGAGTSGKTTQDAIMSLPGLNVTVGLVNGWTGKKLPEFYKNEQLFADSGNALNGLNQLSQEMQDASGNKYGGTSLGAYRDKLTDMNKATVMNERASIIVNQNNKRLAAASATRDQLGAAYDFKANGAFNQKYYTALKKGGILDYIDLTIEEEFPIEIEEVFDESVDKFEKGGAFNVIPEGALHARKHNLDVEGITKKGIPVISEDEEGNIQQHAEIEHSEIIYRLEVTKELEDLRDKYNSDEYTQKEKDEFAIQAGKLLVKETLYNTQDNTNLIQTVN